MLADVAPKNDRATVFASLDAINNVAYVLSLFLCGGLLAGLTVGGYKLLDPITKGGMFWISAVLFIVAALILTFFLKETAPVKEKQGNQEEQSSTAKAEQATSQPAAADPAPAASPKPRSTIASRVRKYFGNFADVFREGRTIQGLCLYRFFFTFSLAIYFVWVPLLALRLGAPDSWLGPIVAISWLTYAVAQPVGGRVSDLSKSRKPLIFWGLIGLAICNTGLALSPLLLGGEESAGPGLALAAMLLFWALLGFPDAMSRPSASALVVDVVKPEHRGKVFGVLGSSATLASIIAPVTYGFLAENVSLMAAFLLTSVSLTAAAIVVGVMIKDPKQEAEQTEGPVTQKASA
jgi:MFS family permease